MTDEELAIQRVWDANFLAVQDAKARVRVERKRRATAYVGLAKARRAFASAQRQGRFPTDAEVAEFERAEAKASEAIEGLRYAIELEEAAKRQFKAGVTPEQFAEALDGIRSA